MATITPTITTIGPAGDGSTVKAVWALVTNADTCAPISRPEMADKSIQVDGTFDSATVVLQGSNDGTNYIGLRNPAVTAISMTAAGLQAVLENTIFIKPVISGGSGSQSLTITMLLHLTNPLRT